MLGSTVFRTPYPVELAVFGAGRQNPIPALVIRHRAGDLLDLQVLVPHPDRPALIRREVSASTPGQTVRWTRTLAPTFLAANPPAATVGTPYSYRLEAKGAPTPTYGLASGTLPAGLTLNPTTGVLPGTPTTAGTATFSIATTNGTAPDVARPLSVVVSARPGCPAATGAHPGPRRWWTTRASRSRSPRLERRPGRSCGGTREP